MPPFFLHIPKTTMLRLAALLAATGYVASVHVNIETDVVSIDSPSMEGMHTFDIYAQISQPATLYAVFGDEDQCFSPPTYQVTDPISNDVGVPPELLMTILPEIEADSFITIGENDNDQAASVGIDWNTWSVRSSLSVTDGAVFYMSPENAPSGRVRLGRITTRDKRPVVVSLQGRNGIKPDNASGRTPSWSDSVSFSLEPVTSAIDAGK
jgi:hypothetical protein